MEAVDFYRLDASRKLDSERRAEFGQFMTPPGTARLMASMFQAGVKEITLLDAGAGVGSLTAAFVNEITDRIEKPAAIRVTTYEIEPTLSEYLAQTLEQCRRRCEANCVGFTAE